MNEQQFDANLRAAFKTPQMPVHMDHKIDAKIAESQRRTLVKRRLTLSFTAAVLVAGGVFIIPPVQAQASLGGIMGALDRKLSAKILTYMVDEAGTHKKIGSTIIANGNVAVLGPKDEVKQVEFENDSFTFEPATNAYVRYPRSSAGGIRLSEMLGPASKFSFDKKVEIVRTSVEGREILRATVTNEKLPERYVIEADAKTQLPFHVQIESLEQNRWRIRQDLEFRYEEGLTVAKPDFSKTELLTPEQNDKRLTDSLTAEVLGRYVAKDKTILIRKVDIAQDGTVFVAYQSGKRKGGYWTGYQLGLKDDLGSNYVRAGDILSNGDVHSKKAPKDGAIELEVFIPRKPISSSQRRKLSLSILVDPSGKISQFVPAQDGEFAQINDSKSVTVFTREFSQAADSVRPSWAAGIYWQFYFDVYTKIFKSQWLARDAMRRSDWTSAEFHLNEELRWKRASEQEGFSSWEMGSTLDNLDKVKKHQTP
jgi:hypothetical protein